MANKKIKILYTIPNFDTAGSGKVVYDLVRHIDKEQFEPHIACFHKKGAFFSEIEKLGVPIHIFSFAISYRPFLTFPFRIVGIIRFFRKYRFDVIHSWHWSSDFSEPLAAKLAGIPFIYTKKSMGWGNRAWKWRSLLSSKIIAVNSSMSPLLLNKYSHKVIQIPFGVNLEYYQPQLKSSDVLKIIDYSKDDFVIVSVVNLIPVKGIEILIDAVNDLNDASIKLIIVGSDYGAYADSLKVKSKQNTNIHFLGKKIDVRPYHAVADVFIIPTLALGEGLPIAPIEAIASGCLVVGSDVPGVRDVLHDFPDCIFESDNIESLKNKIIDILKLTLADRLLLQSEMRAFVENNFSLEGFRTSHEKLYKKIVL